MYICVRVSGCAARARERVRGARAWVCVRVKDLSAAVEHVKDLSPDVGS